MFSRRMFVALVALFVLSASPVFAGGNGGTKKDSTIKVVNTLLNPVYAFVDVPAAQITDAAGKADPIAAFKALGGKPIASGNNSTSFAVKTGAHNVIVVDIVAGAAVFNGTVTTSKGKTSTITVN